MNPEVVDKTTQTNQRPELQDSGDQDQDKESELLRWQMMPANNSWKL
jgi:hypothetical protein